RPGGNVPDCALEQGDEFDRVALGWALRRSAQASLELLGDPVAVDFLGALPQDLFQKNRALGRRPSIDKANRRTIGPFPFHAEEVITEFTTSDFFDRIRHVHDHGDPFGRERRRAARNQERKRQRGREKQNSDRRAFSSQKATTVEKSIVSKSRSSGLMITSLPR